MHLTKVLYRYHFHRLFPRIWKIQNKKEIKDFGIPEELLKMNHSIFKAEDLYRRDERGDPVISSVPIVLDKCLEPSDMKKYFLFHNETRITDGISQVLALTKSLSYEGLPPVFHALVGKTELPNQDHLVQSSINQAIMSDAWQEKLPRKVDNSKPGWVFPRDYGVPTERKVYKLLSKLIILGDMASGKYSDSLKRSCILNACSELLINHGSDPVVFQMFSDFLITSEKPLKCFASPAEVDSTKEQELVSLYPIKPTLDLDQFETCPGRETETAKSLSNGTTHIHTIHIYHKKCRSWSPEQKMARGIAACFSFAAEQAQKEHGDDVKVLPESISIQCIYMDIKSFGFLTYQLNTLDLSHENGVKNQVWIDGPYDLYKSLENEKINDYNPEVFSKILAFHMNGLDPISL